MGTRAQESFWTAPPPTAKTNGMPDREPEIGAEQSSATSEASGSNLDGVAPTPSVAGFAAGVSATTTANSVTRAQAAERVANTIKHTSSPKRVERAGGFGEFVKKEAAGALKSRGPSGKSGARGRLKGHLFEDLDIEAYGRNSANRRAGKKLVAPTDHRNPTYDAKRLVKGKYSGSVQHKAGASGIDTAIKKMEAKTPGSAKRGTVRVPSDVAEDAAKKARGRTRVKSSEVSSQQLDDTLDTGLKALSESGLEAASTNRAAAASAAKSAATGAALGAALESKALIDGSLSPTDFAKNRAAEAVVAGAAAGLGAKLQKFGKATSGGKAVAQGAARSATVSLAIGAALDTPALVRGEIGIREFGENRGVDAVETGSSFVLGSAASAAVLGSSLGGAAATSVGGTVAAGCASAAGMVGGMGTAGGVAAGALGAVSAATVGPAIVGGAAVIGTGLAVGYGFKHIRRKVKERQERRLIVSNDSATSPATTRSSL